MLVQLVAFALAAVFIHEMGHYLAAAVFNIRVKGLRVSRFGSVGIVRERGPLFDSLVVSLAGPAFNLAVAGIFWGGDYELFVLANLCVGLVNLLPMNGSDGSHALECWGKLETAKPDRVRRGGIVDDVRVAEILADLAQYPEQAFLVQAKTQAEAEGIYERVFRAGGDTSRLTISTYPDRERRAA
jgi:hypothetical protein